MHFDWWTFALQIINLLILLGLLQHFLLRPVQAAVQQRQQALRQAGMAAAALQEQARAANQALQDEKLALERARAQAVRTAREQGEAAAQALLSQARADAAAARATAQQQLRQERGEAQAALRQAALSLAGEMARRLLRRLPAANPDQAFLREALASLGGLPPGPAGAPAATLHVISAHPLDQQARSAVAAAIGQQAGPVEVSYDCDPELLAGVELHWRDGVIRNHWRADLQQIAASLHDDAAEHT